MEIRIPSLGDIEEVEVIELCVAAGERVEENDTILVIESDKASMDVPSPAAGVVESLAVAVGDMVAEGHLIATLAADAGTEAPAVAEPEPSAAESAPSQAQAAAPAETPLQTGAESGGAAAQIDVLVPDIGDATGVVVIEVAVKAGDQVEQNDLLVVLESDKASMEIAAEQAGKVMSVAVSEGAEVEEGTLIATLEVSAGSIQAAAPAPDAAPAAAAPPVAAPAAAAEPHPQQDTAGKSVPASREDEGVTAAGQVYAGPAVRRLARELGVELQRVQGSGNRGRITKDDVKAFVKQQLTEPQTAGGGLPQVAEVDYSKFGAVSLQPLTRIQRRGADNLHRSWVNLPHVTQHDEADITDLEAFRQSLKQEGERKGIKVTPLAFLVKACCHALAEYPMFNSSLHADREHLVVKEYINIGMAVDTPEGLVVPVIQNAGQKNIWQLSSEIAELSDKARNKKLAMNDVQGGTFSISSLGALGGTGFTPIVNAPEVAILGVSKLQTKPVWDGEGFQPRKVLPLSLSYDHRVINGADGGRFMVFLTTVLADIRRLVL